MAVFGSFGTDAGIAFALGLLGGLAAELIVHKGGIEIPHLSDEKYLVSTGFISNILLGAVAALAYFFVLDATDPYRFVGATVGAGVGGSAILIAVKEKLIGGLAQKDLENAKDTMQQNANTLEALKTKSGASSQSQVAGTLDAGVAATSIDIVINNLREKASKIEKSQSKQKNPAQNNNANPTNINA